MEIGLGFVSWKIYRHLVRSVLNHETYIEVKVWALADRLHSNNGNVIHALNWLVQRGYLLEAARGSRGVRSFKLTWRIKTPQAA